MKQQEYNRLEESFMGIRDERNVRANTAVRIGTAFLELLRYASIGEFEEISFKKVLNKPEFLEGLISLGTIVLGEYAEGLKGGIITPEGAAELKELWVREHATLGDGQKHYDAAGRVVPALEVRGDSTFTGSLSSPEFVSAFFGGLGWAIQKKEFVNAAGVTEYKYTLEIDNAVIRNTLRVFEMIISQLLGENANRFFSDMMEVDHYDPETGRVWLKTGNGRLYNPFRAGDIVMVQQYNGDPSAENDWYVTKAYELRITAVGIGSMEDGEDRLDWVEFTDFASQMEEQSPEKVIREYDTLVRADSVSNPARKGLVSIMAVGENTPYMDILYGMKTDPARALKGRIGNLEGIRTDLFGWLEGFGAYVNNLYGVGKMFNRQTGESLESSMQRTREMFKQVYRETTYNISDDDNFLKNGFFQDGLEGWTVCGLDGRAVDAQAQPDILSVSSLLTAPSLLNGQPLSVESRTTGEMAEVDGIRVLHLLAMGVSQDFSLIRENGTHEVMASGQEESTDTRTEADTLYMGIRIQPVTSGRLFVRFMKDSGTYTGWERDIDGGIDWLLYQAMDAEGDRWDFSGSGRLVVGYTGECYIRFVALTTDPVANARIQYSTMIEQTSRRITLQARKQTADLNEAVADFTVKYDQISQTVTDNWNAFSRAKATLDGEVARIDGDIAALSSDNDGKWASFATWQSQTNTSISSFATALSVDGRIMAMSSVVQTVSEISQTVADNYNALDRKIGSLSVTAESISGRVTSVEGWDSIIKSHSSNIATLDSEVGALETETGRLKTSLSGVEQWKDEVSMWVKDVDSSLSSLQDPEEWEEGGVSMKSGATFDGCKTTASNCIRYYRLVPITVATTCMLKSGCQAAIVFFGADRKCISGSSWTGWKQPDGYGVVRFTNIPSNATYGAILLASVGGRLTRSGVAATGFFLSNDNVVSEAYMRVFIDDFGTSNAKIKADRISFDYGVDWSVYHDGELMFRLSGDGDIYFRGTVFATRSYYSALDINELPSSAFEKDDDGNTCYRIDPASDPYTLFIGHGYVSDTYCAILPDPEEWNGLVLRFAFGKLASTRSVVPLVLKGRIVDESGGAVAEYGTGSSRVVSLIAIRDNWFVI